MFILATSDQNEHIHCISALLLSLVHVDINEKATDEPSPARSLLPQR